jgi:hypothetical protein
VRLVGFIIKKFVTMHVHMNVTSYIQYCNSHLLVSSWKPNNFKFTHPWRKMTEFDLVYYHTDSRVYVKPCRLKRIPWCIYDWHTKFFRYFSFRYAIQICESLYELETLCLFDTIKSSTVENIKNMHYCVSLLLKRIESFQYWIGGTL